MKLHQKLFLVLQLLCITSVFSQSSCPNSDFEDGTFTGWQGGTGFCCPINITNSGIVTGRHTIMSGTGTDPNACDMITVVAPGGLYSARLGNDDIGAQAEKLSYSLTVSASNSLFIYKYAVVLEDPGHSQAEQPRFQIRVLNAAGNLIDPICGEYTVVSGANIPGFQTCNGDIRYKDWTTVGLDLSAYIGQTITIEFATGDCQPAGHYGYAYVDAYCSPLQISSTYCTGSFAAILSAPIGFSYLWNTGATTQSINVSNPNAGLVYTCLLTSVTGCTVNISTNLTLFDPVANFTITNTCYDDAVFENTTFLPFGTILDAYLWNFGDGTTSTLENPTHTFSAPGTYNVTFTISNALGCTSTTTYPVTVYQSPTANIVYSGNSSFCTSQTTPQLVTLTGTNLYTGGVFSAPTGLTIDATTGAIDPSTSTPGSYVVSYTIPTANGCSVPPSTTNCTIVLSPSATISYPNSPYCGNLTAQQPITFNGLGAFTGGTFTSTAGLTIDSATGAITPISSTGGNYVVTYNVPPFGGCSGFPITTNVVIGAYPTAVLSYAGTPFCKSLLTFQPVTLTGTNGFTGGVYSSTTGLIINSVTGAINPSLSTPGTYTVTYIIPPIANCNLLPVTTSVTITGIPTATISYATPFCRDVTSAPVNLNGTYAYTNGIFTSSPGLSINSATGVIIPSASDAGVYTITYTIPSSGGCASSIVTTSVTIYPLPDPIMVDGDICFNANGNLVRNYSFVSGLSIMNYSFEWFFNGALIPGANLSYYTAIAIGTYSVIATNRVTGCKSSQVFGTVIEAVQATDFFTSIEDTFTQHNVMTVVVQGGTGPFLYQLDNGPIQTSNVFYQVPSGVHNVTVTDDTSCTQITKIVTVMGYPRFFTPNSDGNHDHWNIYYYNDLPEAQVYIFDREGKFLKQFDPSGLGWDGTYNGHMVPATDYWFLVKYKEKNLDGVKESREFRAHFSLKR
jgi:gliding motility-associated-like protein